MYRPPSPHTSQLPLLQMQALHHTLEHLAPVCRKHVQHGVAQLVRVHLGSRVGVPQHLMWGRRGRGWTGVQSGAEGWAGTGRLWLCCLTRTECRTLL